FITNPANGCTSSATLEVMNSEGPSEIVFTAQNPLCDMAEGQLEISNIVGGQAPYRIEINGTEYNELPLRINVPPDSYQINVVDNNGCIINANFDITGTESLSIQISENQAITEGDSVQINVSTNKPLDELTAIDWNPSTTLNCNNCTNPIAFPRTTTTYEVTVMDIDGCRQIEFITITVAENQIFVPNVFSPNGDAINDQLTLFNNNEAVDIIESLEVYDRWGNRVFRKTDFPANIPEEGWDGTYKGKRLNPGVFVYVFQVRMRSGEREQIQGDVSLIR
ncbi:MAG: gliding motility-associated C-terminal domain-containing protein, partial [Bacteroidota bacterium]